MELIVPLTVKMTQKNNGYQEIMIFDKKIHLWKYN